MEKKGSDFEAALSGKRIPYLTLDNKWHKIFAKLNGTPEMNQCAAELNELLKRQGKLNTELREIRVLKKKLMTEVMPLAQKMEQEPDRMTIRKMDEMTRLIEDCNDKIDAHKEELAELPREMDEVNRRLMLITMEVCYKKLQQNTADIKDIAVWIEDMRTQLKENVVHKQQMEIENQKLYAYMHAIFGPDVINLFDMQYVPEPKKQSIKIETRDDEKAKEEPDEKTEQPVSDSSAEVEAEDRQIKIW